MVPRRPAGVARHGDHLLRGVALCGLAFFAAVTVAQHAFVPQLDPGQHTISEYANSDWGWLMTLGFAAWALSLGATALREMLSPLPGRWVFAALLGVASLGLAITAAFATQTTAGMLPPGTIRSTGGALHDHGSGVAQVALFGAVLATALRSSRPRVLRRLAAALFISAVTLTIAFLALGDPVAGIRQRLLLLAAVAWHAALLTSHHLRVSARYPRQLLAENGEAAQHVAVGGQRRTTVATIARSARSDRPRPRRWELSSERRAAALCNRWSPHG